MNRSPERLAARVVRTLVAIELTLVALYLLDLLCGEPQPFHLLFNLDGEANIPAWFSSAQLLAIALTLWTGGRSRGEWPQPSRWFLNLLAVGFLLLSLDETAQVHETVTGLIGSRYIDWVPVLLTDHKLFAVLALVAVFGVLKYFYPTWRAAWRGSRRECTMALIGVCLVLLGGSLIEALGYLWLEKGTMAYKMEVAAEEFLEMFGATLILRAALVFVLARVKRRPSLALDIHPA